MLVLTLHVRITKKQVLKERNNGREGERKKGSLEGRNWNALRYNLIKWKNENGE